MWQAFYKVIKREWLVLWAAPSQWAQPWVFLCLMSVLPAMMLGEQLKTMPIISALLICLAFVFSVMLTLDKSLKDDHLNDTYANWLLSPWPLWWLMTAKAVAHWLFWVLPMVLISPIIMIMLGLSYNIAVALFFCLLISTPLLSFVGLMSASLTLSLRSSGFLVALIMLPLVTPMILLSLSPIQSAILGQQTSASMALLGALTILSVVLCPVACAFGVKVSQSCSNT